MYRDGVFWKSEGIVGVFGEKSERQEFGAEDD